MATVNVATGTRERNQVSTSRIDDTLRLEALSKVAHILQAGDRLGKDTVVFLALMELQKSYPLMPAHDVALLLQQIMKRGLSI